MLVPHHALYPVRKAYREVYAELGPGLEKERYVDALAQRLKDTNHHFETDALIPFGKGKGMHADLTYAHRKVYVKVALIPAGISDGAAQKILFRLNVTGIPMGIILNFGCNAPEYRQVVNTAGLKRRSKQAASRAVS
jgi:GxxExxY protein